MTLATNDSNISALLQASIDKGDFPSAVYLIAESGRAVFAGALGKAVREPQYHPATLDTIYDLASLTKPLLTGLLCALVVEQGQLKLDAPIAQYLREFARSDKNRITIRQLLTHTSGLPAWRPLYLLADGRSEATLEVIAAQPLVYMPGEKVVYSDLGFIVLGLLLQELTGHKLTDLAHDLIINRLNLTRTFFNPDQALQTGVAACETGNQYERDMCEREFSDRSYSHWRTDLIWGQVHDGNAHFLGGAAGHAGLFSTAADVFSLANQFVSTLSELLVPTTCELFRQNMTPGLNEARSFAWQLAETLESTAGPALPRDAFGHTGFTGTSCWIDAPQERVFVLLTNRTHSHPAPFANINAVRRMFHTLAVNALDDQRRNVR